jgi:hypothetical protein
MTPRGAAYPLPSTALAERRSANQTPPPHSLLRANPPKGGDAEPRGYRETSGFATLAGPPAPRRTARRDHWRRSAFPRGAPFIRAASPRGGDRRPNVSKGVDSVSIHRRIAGARSLLPAARSRARRRPWRRATPEAPPAPGRPSSGSRPPRWSSPPATPRGSRRPSPRATRSRGRAPTNRRHRGRARAGDRPRRWGPPSSRRAPGRRGGRPPSGSTPGRTAPPPSPWRRRRWRWTSAPRVTSPRSCATGRARRSPAPRWRGRRCTPPSPEWTRWDA